MTWCLRALAAAAGALISVAAVAHTGSVREQEVLLNLSSGDTVRGVVLSQDESTIVLRHAVLGTLRIPRSGITKVTFFTAPVPAEPQVQPAEQTQVPAAQVEETPEGHKDLPPGPTSAEFPQDATEEEHKSPWRGTIAAAVNYTNNNDTTIDARLAAGLVYEVPDVETLQLNTEYFFKTLNSNTTDNNLLANAVYDRFFVGTNWLWFAKGQYQYSQFEAWENRISAYGGLGYRFFEAPPVALLTKVGAGATHEFGPPQQSLPEAYGEVDFSWDISEVQRLELSSNIAPDLRSLGEFRLLSRAEWKLRVDPSLDLDLTLGMRSQYQSEVPAGDVNHDLRIYAGLQLGF